MNQTEANALLASIKAYAALADDKNFTLHASEGVHMKKADAAARALAEPTKLCGYFQHDQVTTVTIKTQDGWDLPKSQWKTQSTPTGKSEDVSGVEQLRLIKAFFRGAKVKARPGNTPSLATMRGPIPAGFTGYTNALGTDTYTAVSNMVAVVSKGTNWQLVTVYPVN